MDKISFYPYFYVKDLAFWVAFPILLLMRPLVRITISFLFNYQCSKLLGTWGFGFEILESLQLAVNSNDWLSLPGSGTPVSSTAECADALSADLRVAVQAEGEAAAAAAAEAAAEAQADARAQAEARAFLNTLSPLQLQALMEITNREIELFARIRLLEAECAYGLPIQLNPGEYEELVKDNIRQSAYSFSTYLSTVQNEIFDVQIMEMKATLQERLFNLLLADPQIDRIFEKTAFQNIREEAYDFLQSKVEHLDFKVNQFQKDILEGSLRHYLRELERNGANSELFREFKAHFTD
jgi:hypothetical protein